MSKKERAEYPPSSSRYHRTSLTPHSHKAGLGSSSTKVQVLGDGYPPERGYDSEAVRDSPAPQVTVGYLTEGQPSTSKRTSKDLYRTALDPGRRVHGSRMSSMPAGPQTSFGYPYDIRSNQLDNGANHGLVQGMLDGDDSTAEQNSSLRRVKKDRERRHRDRDRDAQVYDRPDARAVPPDVWMQQVVPPQEPKSSRSGKRESRSARRQDETPLPSQKAQPDLPRTYPQTGSVPVDYQKHAHSQASYAYTQQPGGSIPYRPVNATPVPPPPHQDHYRPNPPVSAPPDNYAALMAPTAENQAQIKPRYEYVIDDRAGLRSPPPIEIPHAFPPNSAYEYYGQPESPALALPRTLAQLKADGLIPPSPVPTQRRTHRSVRSEDVNAAGGFFTDGTPSGPYGSHAEHVRQPLRHRPSRSELGLGQPPVAVSDEPHESLVRPVHVGRSASETIIPQQLPTPGMFGAGLAVTSAQRVPAPGERGGIVMHPQLQESFAESANASRAPVNAAMANAAVLGYSNGLMESDSSSAKDKEVSSRRTMKKEKRPRRSSKQPEVVPLPQLQPPQSPPPTDAAHPEPNRQMQAEAARQLVIEPSPPPVVAPHPAGTRPRTTSGKSVARDEEHEPEPDTVVYQTPGDVIPRRVSRSSLSPPLLGSRPELTFAGAGAALGANAPRGEAVHEARGGGAEASARRGSPAEDERARRPSMGAEERGRRPSIETRKVEDEHGRRPSDPSKPNEGNLVTRKSMESDSSFQSYESAVLAGSTAATHDQEYASAKDAMSPRSNYYSVAASVRSVAQSVADGARNIANEARSMANEVRELGATTVIVQSPPAVKAAPAPPPIFPRQGGVRTSSAPSTASGFPALAKHLAPGASTKASAPVPPTPILRPTDVTPRPPGEPELNVRPRAPSGSMPAPPPAVDVPPHRATIDAHMRENVPPAMAVDEEGRLTRTPAVSQTMPARAPRHSLTRQAPPPIGIVTPVASPPQPHAQAQPSDTQASALPKNLQQQQPIGSSKESLVEQNVKASGKGKSSSRWFWSKPKPAETTQKVPLPARAQASSPAPPSVTSPPPPPPSQRVRHPSLLNGLMMGTPISKSKKAPEPAPPAPRLSTEIYQSMDSTPSSLSLEVEPEPVNVKKGMFATLKNTLRRTPSTSKISHGFSRSMSRLPGTSRETVVAPPPPGAPLARSLSAKDTTWPMSPQRVREPLRPTKDNVDVPPPPPVIPAAVPAPPPAPTPAPAVPVPMAVAAPAPPPMVPKDRVLAPVPKESRVPEVVPIKDERRPFGKDVPAVDKGRNAAPVAPRAPVPVEQPKSSRMLVDENGRLVDSASRLVGSTGRPTAESGSRGTAGQRSSVQAAPPPYPRAASPPLVGRPVAATRVPANGPTGIFTSAPQPRPSVQSATIPVTSHVSSRAQPRDRSRSSRDPGPAATPGPVHSSLRTPRPREAVPTPVLVTDPADPAPELGLPTPEATPRSSPTGGAMFDNHDPTQAPPPPREKGRPANIVIPKPDLAAAVGQKLATDANSAPHLKFDHRQKRAVSIASLEAVTGQEAHFRSEASSIRTVTPGPGQTSFPLRDPLSAAHDWTALQLQEDKLAARRDSISRRLQEESSGRKHRGGLKRSRGSRKPGVAFDFPGPVIDEDGEEREDMRQADIELTYELERVKKRYK
ncbi:hypothetical protein FRC10_000123 [Ceratobasidium sp. 414]|nr:hypothetical protein FRC10_000123 [Ceratobasidium sp. 414]